MSRQVRGRGAISRRLKVAVGATLLAIAYLGAHGAGESRAVTVERAGIKLDFVGAMSPMTLPRRVPTPVRVSLGARLHSHAPGLPAPELDRVVLSVNRNGRVSERGLARCHRSMIEDTTLQGAIENCARAVVGGGSVLGTVVIPAQAPFELSGRAVLFNAPPQRGNRRLWLYLTTDIPLSPTILPVRVSRSRGQLGNQLVIDFPRGLRFRLSEFRLAIGSRAGTRRSARGFLRASCPAPGVLPGVTFPLASGTFHLAGGGVISATQIRSCRARR